MLWAVSTSAAAPIVDGRLRPMAGAPPTGTEPSRDARPLRSHHHGSFWCRGRGVWGTAARAATRCFASGQQCLPPRAGDNHPVAGNREQGGGGAAFEKRQVLLAVSFSAPAHGGHRASVGGLGALSAVLPGLCRSRSKAASAICALASGGHASRNNATCPSPAPNAVDLSCIV
jgi:hypothetical protein